MHFNTGAIPCRVLRERQLPDPHKPTQKNETSVVPVSLHYNALKKLTCLGKDPHGAILGLCYTRLLSY